MAKARNRKARPRQVALVVGGVIVLAVIALVAHAIADAPEARYSIDSQQVALSLAEVGAQQYASFSGGGLPPTQMTAFPLPYQQQYNNGWLSDFFADSVLTPQAQAQIDQWQEARGVEPDHPPAIFGPYVAEHSGIFEIEDAEQSYHTASAAHADFVCCPGGFAENFDHWHTLPLHLGDETYAWTGIRDSPTNPGDAYEELTFNIHWRHGPIDSTMWIFGAHDITFEQDIALARIVDAKIVHALEQATKGASHAIDRLKQVITNPKVAALCAVARRSG